MIPAHRKIKIAEELRPYDQTSLGKQDLTSHNHFYLSPSESQDHYYDAKLDAGIVNGDHILFPLFHRQLWNTSPRIQSYSGTYEAQDDSQQTYLAKLNYDHKDIPNFLDPEVKKRIVLVFLEDQQQNILDDDGHVIFQKQENGFYSLQQQNEIWKFKFAEDGCILDPENHERAVIKTTQTLTDVYGRARAYRDEKGQYYSVDASGKRSLLYNRGKFYYNADGKVLFRRLDDGSLYDDNDLLLTAKSHLEVDVDNSEFSQAFLQAYLQALNLKDAMPEFSQDESHSLAYSYRLNLTACPHFASSDENGIVKFDYAFSKNILEENPCHSMYFRYAVGGGLLSEDRTEVHIDRVSNQSSDIKQPTTSTPCPIWMVDVEYLRSLSPKNRKQLAAILLQASSLYKIEYYTGKILERTHNIEHYLKMQGFPGGAIHVGDEGGSIYQRLEGILGNSLIRHMTDIMTQGMLNGQPYSAVIADPQTSQILYQLKGFVTFMDKHKSVSDNLKDLQETIEDPQSPQSLAIKSYADEIIASRNLGDREKLAWDLRYAIGGREETHDDVQMTVMTSGPKARSAEFDMIDSLSDSDLFAGQIYEMQKDKFDQDITQHFSDLLTRGGDIVLTQDWAGVNILEFFQSEGGRLKRKLHRLSKQTSGKFYHAYQPFFGDAGPLHIDHRKRAVIVNYQDWKAPDGNIHRVPVIFTKISGRNWTEENHHDPKPSLKPQDYDAKESPYYDTTSWLYDQNLAEENLWDLLNAFNLDKGGVGKEPDLISILFSKNLPDDVANHIFLNFDFRSYQREAQEIYKALYQTDEFHKDKLQQEASVEWSSYRQKMADAAHFTLSDWIHYHLAQNILIQLGKEFNVDEYQKIYQDTLKEIKNPALSNYDRVKLVTDYREITKHDEVDWRKKAQAEAASYYLKNDALISDMQDAMQNDPERIACSCFDLQKMYDDFKDHYTDTCRRLLGLDADIRDQKIEQILAIPVSDLKLSDLPERKAAMAIKYREAMDDASHILYEHDIDDQYNYWRRNFSSSKDIALFWLHQNDFIRPKIVEMAYKSVAKEYIKNSTNLWDPQIFGNESFAFQDGDLIPDLESAPESSDEFRDSYRKTFQSLMDAEQQLKVTKDQSYIKIQDGLELARDLMNQNQLLKNDESLGQMMAALTFLNFSQGDQHIQDHDQEAMERDNKNFFFDGIDVTSINHQGAWRYDLRDKEAFTRRVFEPSEKKFMATIEYPMKDEQVDLLIKAKQELPDKRFVIVMGPLMHSLDQIRIHAIKRLISAGVEVWFTPNQRMHAKLWNGNIGSDNSADYFSEKNNEVTADTTDPNFVRVIQDDHLAEVLMERAVPLHLLPPEQVNDILGFKRNTLFLKGKGFLSLFEG